MIGIVNAFAAALAGGMLFADVDIDKLCPPRAETAAKYEAGTYPEAVRPYRDAALAAYHYMTSLPAMTVLLETGKPNQRYQHNAYVSKTHAAHIEAMLSWAKAEPARREDAMRFAKASAEFLLSELEPPNAPLAWWPPTYGRKPLEFDPKTDGPYKKPSMIGNEPEGAVKYRGEVMLVYPADVGRAFLAYYDVTKDARFLVAAKGIGETYLRTRRSDGSWPLKMRLATGETVGENTLVPDRTMLFFESLHAATGEKRWRDAEDAAFAWLEAHPLSDWNWDGQFEDIKPETPYKNPTKHNAIETMMYILRRFPGDAKRLVACRKILEFCEKRFVVWKAPKNHLKWPAPSVLEQYSCFTPIDASVSKMIRGYLAMYRAEGLAEDREKAKALGNMLTRVQKPSGRIPTFWEGVNTGDSGLSDERYDWLNCMASSARALLELADCNGIVRPARPCTSGGTKPVAFAPTIEETLANNSRMRNLTNDWPFVILRSYGSAAKNSRFTARIFAAQERHPGLIEEIWFAGGVTNDFARPEEFGAGAARENLSVRDRCRQHGIAFSYQQGMTLGHWPDGRPHPGIPDDAWAVDREGRLRQGLFCCTSPFARDHAFRKASAILAALKPDSYWPDDDLRLSKFNWSKPFICFCDRCLRLFAKRHPDPMKEPLDRTALLAALEGTNAVPAVRHAWSAFNGEMLGEYAGAFRRAVDAASPQTRLGIQIALDGNSIDGDSWKHMLQALAGPDGRAGIRPGGLYYTDRTPRAMLPKMGLVAREAARSGRLPCCGQICYEVENWPHIGANKNPNAMMAECAVALAVGCDSLALYWGADLNTQSDEAYDYWFDCVARWKPLWTKIRDTFRGTELDGLAVCHGSAFFASDGWITRAHEGICRIAENGVPITVAEAAPSAWFLDARSVAELGADDLPKVFAKPVLVDLSGWKALAARFPTLGFLKKVEIGTGGAGGYERFADGLQSAAVRDFVYPKSGDVRAFSMMTADPKAAGTVFVPTEFGGAVVLVQNATKFGMKEEFWADGRRHAILDALDAAVPGKMPVRLLTDGYSVGVFARKHPDGTPAGALLFNFGAGETPPLQVAFRLPSGEKVIRVPPMQAYQPVLVTPEDCNDFDICQYGASVEATPKANAAAIQKAIDAASAVRGRVVVPKGEWVSGTVWLKSGVELHLAEGAVLKASPNLADYNAEDAYPENFGCPTTEYWRGFHFIICRCAEDVSITGSGTIHGNGDVFFEEKPVRYFSWMTPTADCWWNGIRWSKDKVNLRPGQLVAFIKCRNVNVRGITIRNAPCWSMFFHGCRDVTVRDYTVRNGPDDGNTDGIDIDCCQNVLLEDLDVETGDDGVAIRGSGRRLGLDPQPPCENITVRRAKLDASSSVFRIGVGDGLIRNVTVEDVTSKRGGTAINLNACYGDPESGGVDMERIVFRRCRFDNCRKAYRIWAAGKKQVFGIRDILFEDVAFPEGVKGKIGADKGSPEPVNVRFTSTSAVVPQKEKK